MEILGWNILTNPNKLWVRILNEKYLRNSAFFDCIPNANQSPLWSDILKGRELLEKGLIVGIGNGGTTSLWYHHWIGEGPIYKFIDKDVPNSKTHWFVSHIIRNGKWFLDDIRHLLPPRIVNLISSYLCLIRMKMRISYDGVSLKQEF